MTSESDQILDLWPNASKYGAMLSVRYSLDFGSELFGGRKDHKQGREEQIGGAEQRAREAQKGSFGQKQQIAR